MKSVEELRELKDNMQNLVNPNRLESTRIIVGMATCGLAAGAEPVYNTLRREVKKAGLTDIKVVKVGCIGMCRLEPIVEVLAQGKPKITYVKVTPQIASRIIKEHIIEGNVVAESVIED